MDAFREARNPTHSNRLGNVEYLRSVPSFDKRLESFERFGVAVDDRMRVNNRFLLQYMNELNIQMVSDYQRATTSHAILTSLGIAKTETS
jgi:hypothetical protein